jgi:uncharacterized membrane protein YbhN (UPF0104 family)
MRECLEQTGLFQPAAALFLAISGLFWLWLIKDVCKWRHLSKEERKKLRERYARAMVLSCFFFLLPIFAFFFPFYAFTRVLSCF